MYRNNWKSCYQSVCSISFFSNSEIRNDIFTGFKVFNKYIVSSGKIYNLPKFKYVKIVFEKASNRKQSFIFSYKDFAEKLIKLDENGQVFSLIILDDKNFNTIPSLKLSNQYRIEIGHPIAVLGYQLDKVNLSIRSGIISSDYKDSNGFETYDFDCNICQGISGAPLIDGESNEVIGVVGQRLSHLADSYKRLKQIINNNLAILKKSQGKTNIHDVDPVQVLIASQNQIKHIVSELYKTTNIGNGSAVKCKYINSYFEELSDIQDSIRLKKMISF